MNMHLWVAANETTAETNIYKYEVEKMREEARITEAGKKRPNTVCKDGTAPAFMPQFQKV